jgi:hypothetical protein
MKNGRNVAAVASLTLALLASASTARAAAEPDPLTPSDAEVMVQINVRWLLQTPLMKKHALDPLQLLLQRDEEVRQLLRTAGLDPLKDVDTIAFSASGNPAADGKMLVVVRGDFAPDKVRSAVEEYAKKHPGRVKSIKHGELPMWEIPDENKAFYAAFAGNKTLVMTAKKEDTAEAVGRASRTPRRPSKEMRAALDHLQGSEGIWMAAVATDDVKRLLQRDDNSRDFAAALQSVTGAVAVHNDARLSLVVHTNSAEAAAKVKTKLDDLMKLVHFLGAGQDNSARIAKEVLDNVQLKTDKNDVSIRLQVTEAWIEKARQKDR